MSFQSKGFWLSKDAGCLIDGEITYDNASRIEPKRLHQWFMDGGEAELFPNKKQAVEVSSSNSFGGISPSALSPWGNVASFQSVTNQFSERLFDTEATRSINFHERNIASVNARSLDMGRKVLDDPFGSHSSFDLSMSHSLVDPKTCINYSGLRKVKVNEVRDSENLMSMSMEASMGPSFARDDNNVIPTAHDYGKVDDSGISMGLTYGRDEDTIITIGDPYGREDDNFVSVGQSFNKGDVSKIAMGCNYKSDSDAISLANSFGNGESNILSMAENCRGDSNIISMGALSKGGDNMVSMSHTYEDGESLVSISNNYGKGDDINRTTSIAQSNNKGKCHSSSMGHSFDKGARNIISFGGCNNDDDDINASGRLISSYDLLMSQTSVPRANTLNHKELVVSDTDVLINTAQGLVSVANPASKKKDDPKSNKKTPPNNFPSNVRSLLSTGILDEVPVKYIAWSREKELRGVIKGSGYLCGCQSCNFSKVINAYEFERHAGCKTKHPNNHIYFENGKTIYGIVQELRSTPQNMLFDVIQTITGSPINQKSFRVWKESFLAATRELQRIYGKDERDQPV